MITGAYHNPAPTTGGPAFTIAGKGKDFKPTTGDIGPGEYHVEAPATGGPAYTIAGRPASPKRDDAAPGPGAYTPQVRIYFSQPVDARPTLIMVGKPNEHTGLLSTASVESSHMQQILNLMDRSLTCILFQSLQAVEAGPAFTIVGKPKEKTPGGDLPAPGDYNVVMCVNVATFTL